MSSHEKKLDPTELNPSTDSCEGCKHNIPGDCSARFMGDDGYLHFPPDGCFTPYQFHDTELKRIGS